MANNYWANRLDETTLKMMDVGTSEIENELIRLYLLAADNTIKDMELLYSKLVEERADGKIRPNDFYRYDRYYNMLNNLNNELTKLGSKEVRLLYDKLEWMYQVVEDKITEISPHFISASQVGNGRMEEVVKSIWCADGKHFSDRV